MCVWYRQIMIRQKQLAEVREHDQKKLQEEFKQTKKKMQEEFDNGMCI